MADRVVGEREERLREALERIADRNRPAYPDEIEIAREALASSPSPPDRESPALTMEQAYFARRRFSLWLQIKEEWERANWTGDHPKRWKPGELTKHRADVDHSALLVWLLTGHEPLPEPPPLDHAYPVYPWGDES